MIEGHGGNIYELARKSGCSPWDIIDMSSNVNPLGPLPGLMTYLKENLHAIAALPEVDARTICKAFADYQQINPEFVLAGNGTTQFIYTIPRVLGTKKALIIGPTYADYADSCQMNQVSYSCFLTDKADAFMPNMNDLNQAISAHDTIFICNPNNPTATLIPVDTLEGLCRSNPDKYFVIDESYLPFVNLGVDHSMITCGLSNVMVLHSLSKIFGIPGLRIGFLISPIKMIEKFRNFNLPWSVNSLAQAAVQYLADHEAEMKKFISATHAFLASEGSRLRQELSRLSAIKAFPSVTSFILLELQGLTAAQLCERLSAARILIRNCDNFEGLNAQFARISLKSPQANTLLIEQLRKEFGKE